MAYIPFTNEQLIRANTVDLVEFLRLKGEKLERCGKNTSWSTQIVMESMIAS